MVRSLRPHPTLDLATSVRYFRHLLAVLPEAFGDRASAGRSKEQVPAHRTLGVVLRLRGLANLAARLLVGILFRTVRHD